MLRMDVMMYFMAQISDYSLMQQILSTTVINAGDAAVNKIKPED